MIKQTQKIAEYDECAHQILPLFPDIQVTEGIVLNYRLAPEEPTKKRKKQTKGFHNLPLTII